MENIRIAILSHDNRVVCHADNTRPLALHYYDDTLTTYIEGSAHTFSFTVSSKHIDSNYIVLGGNVSFRYKDTDYFFSIVNIEEDEKEKRVECYGNSLELTNRYVGSYTGTSLTFAEYLNLFDTSHVIEFGINEISARRRSLELSDGDTLLSRVFTLATNFGAEIAFKDVLDEHYRLNKIVLDVFKENDGINHGVGTKRYDKYRYGKDINGIRRYASIDGLYTAIKPIGNNDINIRSKVDKVYNEEGKLEFFTLEGSSAIYAPIARDMFPSRYGDGEQYIEHECHIDTDSVDVLYKVALYMLKVNSMPQLEYDVEGFVDANIGDSIIVIDESFSNPLYIRARIMQQEIHFTEPDKNKTTFDNFTTLKSVLNSPPSGIEYIYTDDDFEH